MEIDGKVTLIAAIIAALTSIISIVINLYAGRSAEMRVAYRNSLNPYLDEISNEIYSTIACTKILTLTKTKESFQNWQKRTKRSKTKLTEIRMKLRYQLWGITDSMRTLALLPDWIEHALPLINQQYTKELLHEGHALGVAIDEAVLNAYTNGRRPNWIDRLKVRKADQRIREIYMSMQNDEELKELGKDLQEEE